MDEEEAYRTLPHKAGTHKRKREAELDNAHQIYGDSLLDYFIVVGKDDASPHSLAPPQMPEGFQVDRPIDNNEHTSLHWAASMGDLDMVKVFINFGANKHVRNLRGETPLIRALIFTNCYAKDVMPKMVHLLQETFQVRDNYGGTVFHHAAALTLSHVKKKAARYYLNILLNLFREMVPQDEFFRFLNTQDQQGDTALHIVARNHAKRCVRALQGHGVAGDIPNEKNVTADQILLASHRTHQYDLGSSSPIHPLSAPGGGNNHSNGIRSSAPRSSGLPSSSNYETQPARSLTESFATLIPDKSLQLMLALEQGVQEKAEDLAQANRLLRGLELERDQVRQDVSLLLDQLRESENDDTRAAEEEAMLLRESESLMEQIQHKTLHQEIRAEETQLSPLAHHGPSPSSSSSLLLHNNNNNNKNPLTLTDGDLPAAPPTAHELEKLQAAQRLARHQQDRRAAVSEAIQAMATAGMTEKGETYKRLLVNTLGVSADEVLAIVPEMLELFEMARMDADAEGEGGVGVGAGAGVGFGDVGGGAVGGGVGMEEKKGEERKGMMNGGGGGGGTIGMDTVGIVLGDEE